MSIERHFFGWDRPCLHSVADFLLAQENSEGLFMLRDWFVVVPGSRAGRRLLELLATGAEERSKVLVPPRIVTPGVLFDELCRGDHRLANSLEQELALMQVLSACRKSTLDTLVPGGLSSRAALQAFARRVLRLWEEISASALTLEDIARRGREHFTSFQPERWLALAELFEQYLTSLLAAGLSDKNQVRIAALQSGALVSPQQVLLVALLDLPELPRKILGALDSEVVAGIFAPEAQADYFDEFGCVIPEPWLSFEIPLEDKNLLFSWDYSGQGADAARTLASCAAHFSAQEITIGVTDTDLIPFLTRELHDRELSGRPATSRSLGRSAPAQLLGAIAEYIQDDYFPHAASLLRHPDFERLLIRTFGLTPYIGDLDAFQADHLQERFSRPFPRAASRGRAAGIYEAVEKSIAAFRAENKKLSSWVLDVAEFLRLVYSPPAGAAPDMELTSTLGLIAEALGELKSLPHSLDQGVSLPDAIETLLGRLSRMLIPAEPEEDAIDILGWLELPLDDAPCVIFCGAVEGRFPESLNADSLLPNSLRKHLGLLDNDLRYARDACALTSLLNSRPVMKLLASRLNAGGDALALSRLVLSAPDETLAARVHAFYDARVPLARREGVASTAPLDALPKPKHSAEPPASVSATGFRDYLACPYRYYLKHILRLDSLTDEEQELDPLGFGILAHDALRLFAVEKTISQSTDSKVIDEFLQQTLESLAALRFGKFPLPAVRLQIKQLGYRLSSFAHWQAAHAAAGWRIRHAELGFNPGDVMLQLEDDRSISIVGRIDRIDFHQGEGKWCIFDYKTSEKRQSAKTAHQARDGSWRDLQLPAYHFMFRTSNADPDVASGYISLDTSSEVDASFTKWTPAELEESYRVMREIAEKIHEQVFWPPNLDNWPTDKLAETWGIPVLDRERMSAEDGEE